MAKSKSTGTRYLGSTTSSAARKSNPFSSISIPHVDKEYLAQLNNEGVNLSLYNETLVKERNKKIDDEYKKQVSNLKTSLDEKWPLASLARLGAATGETLAQAKLHLARYNRELNQGIKRLRRLANEAKKK